MATLKKIALHTSHYFTGEVLVMLAGLISFPILTRIFTKNEYGIMSLVSVTHSLATTIGSGGLRTSAIRFYGELKEKREEVGVGILYSTLLTGSLFMGLTVTGILFFSQYILPSAMLSNEFFNLIRFSSFLILFQIISGLILTFLRAEEKTVIYTAVYVSKKYLGLILAIIFVVYMSNGLYGLYGALLIAEGVSLLYLLSIYSKKYKEKLFKFSRGVFWMAAAYGFPLLGQNVAGFIADYGDRYLIQSFLGFEQVAIYSVGYNLSSYIQGVVVHPLNMALVPVCMNLWSQKGPEETKEFLSKYLVYFCMLAIPVVFGLTAVRHDAIALFASTKYEKSTVIIPYVITGVILLGSYFPFLSGLYLYKRTAIIALLLIISAVLNILMNLFLIPAFGIKGAAIATLLSYIVYIFIGAVVSQNYLKIEIPFLAISRYISLSAIMYIFIHFAKMNSSIAIINPTLKVTTGIITYVILLFFFDKHFREVFCRVKKSFSCSSIVEH